MPKLSSTISLICKNRFNPFDSVPLATLRFVFLKEILRSHPRTISLNFETQGCQWHGIKRIESIFAGKGNSGTSLQIVLISSIKPISSNISGRYFRLLFFVCNEINAFIKSFTKILYLKKCFGLKI